MDDQSQAPNTQRNDREPREHRDNRTDRAADRERISSFEQMKVWQEAHALVLRIFEMTPRIPADQQEGLAVMLEKAAIEVPRSIAEGFKRRGSRNKAHHYNLAQSGLEGLRYLLILGRDLKFDVDYDDLAYRSDQVSRMLDGLVRSMSHTEGRGGRQRGRSGRNDNRRRGSNDDNAGAGSDTGETDDHRHWDDDDDH